MSNFLQRILVIFFRYISGVALIPLILIVLPTSGIAQQQWCATYTCPNCAAHGAGPDTQRACFASKGECENLIRQNFSGNYYGSVTACTANGAAGGAADADGSINGLVKQSSQAIAKGVVYGNGQMVGMGLAGFGVALLLSGDDPQQAAQAEQARQAEMQRQLEESRRAQEEIMRRQEQARQRIMHDLKDSTGTGGLQLKSDTDAPLMVAEVSSSLQSHTLIPILNGNGTVLAGMQMKGLDDSAGAKSASNSGFDSNGKLLGSITPTADIPTPAAQRVLTRQEKIQQALQQDPAYTALVKKKDDDQKTVDDAQKKLDDLNQQKQAESNADKQQELDQQINEQSRQLDTARQNAQQTDNQMKIIETKIAGSADIID